MLEYKSPIEYVYESACVYHMQKVLDIRLITETLNSPLLSSFLQASSALLPPFHFPQLKGT